MLQVCVCVRENKTFHKINSQTSNHEPAPCLLISTTTSVLQFCLAHFLVTVLFNICFKNCSFHCYIKIGENSKNKENTLMKIMPLVKRAMSDKSWNMEIKAHISSSA